MNGSNTAPGSSLIGLGDRIVMNIFADPTKIAHALGLNIELPDCDNEDPAYWETIHADGGYKSRIESQIADPCYDGDPGWALLMRLPWGEVWFDIEEGIKLFLPATDIADALALLDRLRAQGIELAGEDGRSLVWAIPQRVDDDVLARVRTCLEAAGLVQGINDIVWQVPPSNMRS